MINIGSVDGLVTPRWENYSSGASKAGLHALTRHLAHRLAGEHITVNTIAPGPFATDMLGLVTSDPEADSAMRSRVPLGRYGRAADIAGTVRFRGSDAGSYVTGAVLPLDGGLSGCAG